ncbi:TetR/AcrR family transcriptional regulator [Plantactinospora sonchi]|uniref:TetR/AcrR family transcriptional regulator n=1 Tax=Plantactinospora sonchi TaxID=1544735 RepID=A0ABU7RM46_9ACTN
MGRGETTRERILAAAGAVIQERGLAHTTTKEIARVAGYSEATLYKHFSGKEDLVLAVMWIALRPFVDMLIRLPEQAGAGCLRAQLVDLVHQMLRNFQEAGPLAMGLFAEPALLERQRTAFERAGGGPHRAPEQFAAYLRAEQRLGRLSPDSDPVAVANLFVGACFHRAFLLTFMTPAGIGHDPDRFAEGLADAVVRGFTPPRGDGHGS